MRTYSNLWRFRPGVLPSVSLGKEVGNRQKGLDKGKGSRGRRKTFLQALQVLLIDMGVFF